MGKGLKEETLDPEDWDEMRALGHRMMDDMMTFLREVREHKFELIPVEAIKNIRQPLPLKPRGYEQVYNDFVENVLPYPTPNIHPRFWALVAGTGSVYGMLAEMLAAGMNTGSAQQMFPTYYVHEQVIDWIKEILEYPSEAGGVLVSGGSMANYTGLAVARNVKAKVDMKKHGIQGAPQKMTLYCSTQGHGCLIRSVELLGLGNEALRWIPVDDDYMIDIEALEKAISRDKDAGHHPFCVIGNAGTVNTGAFDDINMLADICDREDMWLHVDGAFGAWVKLSKTHRHLASGIEMADSLAVDLHKWMYMPYEIGCTLVRNREAHYKTFRYEAEYLETVSREPRPADLSVQLSRYFKALKAWMLLKADGVEKYARLIQQNLDQAGYLAGLVKEAPELELTAPVSSNVVCFRYFTDGLDNEAINELNQKILPQLWFGSNVIPSDTTLKGIRTLRACIVNHRSKREDFDYLIKEVIRIGKELQNSS